jgi:hypothetical protein
MFAALMSFAYVADSCLMYALHLQAQRIRFEHDAGFDLGIGHAYGELTLAARVDLPDERGRRPAHRETDGAVREAAQS